MKITNEAIKTVKKLFWWGHLLFKTKSQNFNRDNSKTLFNHCLLHVISLRGLRVKANAKTAFKT